MAIANHVVRSLEEEPERWYTNAAVHDDRDWDTADIWYISGERMQGSYAYHREAVIWVHTLRGRFITPWALNVRVDGRTYGGVTVLSVFPLIYFMWPRWKIFRAVQEFDKADKVVVAMGIYNESN